MRTLLVTIFVGLFITLALSSPLPAPAVWVAEKALGPDHPAMSCISATERRCKAPPVGRRQLRNPRPHRPTTNYADTRHRSPIPLPQTESPNARRAFGSSGIATR